MSENFWTWANILNVVILVATGLLGLYAVWIMSRARRLPAPRIQIESEDIEPVERLQAPAKVRHTENVERFVALLKDNDRPDA